MKRLTPLLPAAALLLGLTVFAAPATADDVVVLDAGVVRILDAKTLRIAVPRGRYAGHWNLSPSGGTDGFKVGQRGQILASSAVLDRKSGPVKMKKFKGTDEELQAMLDWFGSLEAQEPD